MSYELIDKQVIYNGTKLRLEVHHLRDEDGKRHKREVVVHPGAVAILPFITTMQIMLIRNRRYAIGQPLLELPAGTLEPKEDPMNCAGRELLEETGYLAGRLQMIGSFFTSPGILSEKMYCFAAYDLQKNEQALEDGEEIELIPTEFSKAINMIRSGQIQDAKTIAALLMYERFFVPRPAQDWADADE